MKSVVQRVSKANVKINGKVVGEIGKGIVVFLAVSKEDNDDTIKWMVNKLINLRIFSDENDKMNRSILDIGGEILLISNFTLYGDAKRGYRPSFTESAPPEISEPIYNKIIQLMRSNYPINIQTGEFGAMMDVELINDGPVTIIIDK